jgi:hypothetical protein
MSAYAQVGGQPNTAATLIAAGCGVTANCHISCGGFPGRSVRAHGPASGDDDEQESMLDTFRAVWFSTIVIITQGVRERNSSMRRVAAAVSG